MKYQFSIKEVADFFSLKENRLRYWAQTGFINPSARNRRHYTFGDLVEIKLACTLFDAGIPLPKTRKLLHSLRETLPNEPLPLRCLWLRSDGDVLTVSDHREYVSGSSNSHLVDISLGELERDVAQRFGLELPKRVPPLATITALPTGGDDRVAVQIDIVQSEHIVQSESPKASTGNVSPTVEPPDEAAEPPQGLVLLDRLGISMEGWEGSAYHWFLQGCELETDPQRIDDAIDAYRNALRCDTKFAAAYMNLGNLLYTKDRREEALACYQEACRIDPMMPEAHYNLGNLHEESEQLEWAIVEYRRALELSPEFADAHYNLAATLERVGSRIQARTHWERYLALTASSEPSEWRVRAQEHVATL